LAALQSLEELFGSGKGGNVEDNGNEEEDLALGVWRKLEHLVISHCEVAELTLKSLRRLPHLCYLVRAMCWPAWQCHLVDLLLICRPSIVFVPQEIQHNALSSLGPLEPLHNLKYLDASFNSIHSFVDTPSWSTQLTVLVLHKNEIKNLR